MKKPSVLSRARWPSLLFLLACTGACRRELPRPEPASASASPGASASPTPTASAGKPEPELPLVQPSWHLVARASSSISIAELDNAGIAIPYSSSGMAPEVLLLQRDEVRLVRDLFAGVLVPEEHTAMPPEGAWPGPLLLTLANLGPAGATEGRVLTRQGGRWLPVPEPLRHEPSFLLLPGPGAQRRVLTQTDTEYVLSELATGRRSKALVVHAQVQGREFRLEHGAADDKGRLFLLGTALDPPPPMGAGGGREQGSIVIQRFEPGAREPVVEQLPAAQGSSAARSSSGLVARGAFVRVLLHGEGPLAHGLAEFDGKAWRTEPVPIPDRCGGSYGFTGAADGSLFFRPTDCFLQENIFVSREPSGRYVRIALPADQDNCELYPLSESELWLGCVDAKTGDGTLFFTRPLGEVRQLAPAGD